MEFWLENFLLFWFTIYIFLEGAGITIFFFFFYFCIWLFGVLWTSSIYRLDINNYRLWVWWSLQLWYFSYELVAAGKEYCDGLADYLFVYLKIVVSQWLGKYHHYMAKLIICLELAVTAQKSFNFGFFILYAYCNSWFKWSGEMLRCWDVMNGWRDWVLSYLFPSLDIYLFIYLLIFLWWQHKFVFWYTRRAPGVRSQTSYEDNIKTLVDFSTVWYFSNYK